MKFKSSKFEVRYNSFWNDEVVSSYKLLINHPEFKGKRFFSENYPSIESLLIKYSNGIVNIVNNMQRQMDNFDDFRNIARYLADVKLQAIDDLNEFKAKIESCFKESPNLFLISCLISKLESGDSHLSLIKVFEGTDFNLCDNLDPYDFLYQPQSTATSDNDMDIDNLDELNLEDPGWKFK